MVNTPTNISDFVTGVLGFKSLGAYLEQALQDKNPEARAGQLIVELTDKYAVYLKELKERNK